MEMDIGWLDAGYRTVVTCCVVLCCVEGMMRVLIALVEVVEVC